MEDEGYPTASGRLDIAHRTLEVRERVAVGTYPDRIRVGRWDALGAAAQGVSRAGAIVAAGLDHRLDRAVVGAVWISKVSCRIAMVEQVDPVIANLALGLGRIDLEQVVVIGGVAADLVAVTVEISYLLPGHVEARRAEERAVEVESRVHVVVG